VDVLWLLGRLHPVVCQPSPILTFFAHSMVQVSTAKVPVLEHEAVVKPGGVGVATPITTRFRSATSCRASADGHFVGGGGASPHGPIPGFLSSDRITIRAPSARRIPADGDLLTSRRRRARRGRSGCARADPRQRLLRCVPLGLPGGDSGSAEPAGATPGASTASRMHARRRTRWHRSTPPPLVATQTKCRRATAEVVTSKREHLATAARHEGVWVKVCEG